MASLISIPLISAMLTRILRQPRSYQAGARLHLNFHSSIKY